MGNQFWLIVIAAAAGFVIVSGRSAAVVSWLRSTFGQQQDALTGELAIIVNLVRAGKVIADPEQKLKVRDACVACFLGWLKQEIPES